VAVQRTPSSGGSRCVTNARYHCASFADAWGASTSTVFVAAAKKVKKQNFLVIYNTFFH
jgi:hypothetical protein